QTRQGNVRFPCRFVDDGPGTRLRPELETEIGIIGNLAASLPDDLHRTEDGVAGLAGNGLADPGNVQIGRLTEKRFGQLLRPHPAGGRSSTAIGEGMAFRAVGDEIDAGGRLRVPLDATMIHAFPRPESKEGFAEGILPEGRHEATAGSLPRRCDDGVGGVAAKTLKVAAPAFTIWELAELHHGFAQSQNIEPLHLPCPSLAGNQAFSSMLRAFCKESAQRRQRSGASAYPKPARCLSWQLLRKTACKIRVPRSAKKMDRAPPASTIRCLDKRLRKEGSGHGYQGSFDCLSGRRRLKERAALCAADGEEVRRFPDGRLCLFARAERRPA